jgi:hypothetical protein
MPRKKKTESKKEPIGPQEYKGWKVGDYVYSHREPDDKLSFGKITNIHLKDSSGLLCFTFACEMCGQYRLSLFEKIIDDPTSKMRNAKVRAKNRDLTPKPKKKK